MTVAFGRVSLADARYKLVRPKHMPAGETIRIHGLRETDLAQAPPLSEVLDELLDGITGRALIAHVAAIEAGFLDAALGRRGLRLRNPVVDTAALAKELRRRQRRPAIRQPVGLSDLARSLHLPVHRPHQADGDALTTAQVFLALATHLDRFKPQTVGSLERFSRPTRLGVPASTARPGQAGQPLRARIRACSPQRAQSPATSYKPRQIALDGRMHRGIGCARDSVEKAGRRKRPRRRRERSVTPPEGMSDVDQVKRDEQRLAELGYGQELSRSWSAFTNFAISFTIISVLLVLTNFALAWNNGGPIVASWGCSILCAFVLMVAFSMAELTSKYPTAGGPYWWAHDLAARAGAG